MVHTRNSNEDDTNSIATKACWDDNLTRTFCELCVQEVGNGWCPRKKTIDATPEWWDLMIKERPDFKPFRKRGIDPELKDMLDCMFGDIVATGDQAWAPSSGVMLGGASTEDAAPGEGFGDSDENESEGAVNAKENVGENVELCDTMSSKRKSVSTIVFPTSPYGIGEAMDALRAMKKNMKSIKRMTTFFLTSNTVIWVSTIPPSYTSISWTWTMICLIIS
ncbi:hypothetical protein COLO4_04748 [Corchorus olitorius]|uniref:Myb/SANT-like domain-containing protein n=1 Tax=Corchorus olitorius TaxID=93759 RepID=A0A1R3KT08_9ROSI|nr:hypothetical protein COLO4_04748 [Corchorus olitorius]